MLLVGWRIETKNGEKKIAINTQYIFHGCGFVMLLNAQPKQRLAQANGKRNFFLFSLCVKHTNTYTFRNDDRKEAGKAN